MTKEDHRLVRVLHRAYAAFRGYFWLPCPVCGRYFGGHECGFWGVPKEGDWRKGKVACKDPRCQDRAKYLTRKAREDQEGSRLFETPRRKMNPDAYIPPHESPLPPGEWLAAERARLARLGRFERPIREAAAPAGERHPATAVGLGRLVRLCAAAPDGLLMMSRDDCHALKVSSIVVGHSDSGGLRRVFLAWPGHRLAENHLHGNLPVGIHNHRYSLRLQLIAGKVRNTTYRRGPGRVLRAFEFRSGQMQAAPKVLPVGFTEIGVSSQSWLSADDWLTLGASTLHDVDCEGPAAWIVEEGPVEQDVTRLFTPRSRIETGELYRPFEDPEAVRAHVARFISLANAELSEPHE